jgi:hypothetical protein
MATVMSGGTYYQNDRESLARFLIDSEQVLRLFVDYRSNLLPEYMHGAFVESWGAVRDAIQDAIAILRGSTAVDLRRPLPPSLRFDDEELERRLEFFGLTGIQLHLKLTSFYHTYQQVMQAPPFEEIIVIPPVTPRQRELQKKKGGWMGWLLEKINSILGSLAKVIPSVDIVKEFKEMAESGYKESELGY